MELPEVPIVGSWPESSGRIVYHSPVEAEAQKRYLSGLETHRGLPPEQRPRWYLFQATWPVTLDQAVRLVRSGIAAPRGIRDW